MSTIQLFHTSPEKISSITTEGRFGEFLFFSSGVYVMSATPCVTYSIDIAEDSIINAGSLFYHEDASKLDGLVNEFCERFDVDTDTAEEIISERHQLDRNDADDSWDVQLFTARAAKALGFRAVAVSDEQGTAYMIDMAGRESEMVMT
ncbi:hypothetical protein ACCE15_05340 [Pseudomonas parafulva]|uniref:hypothetical protein n=1 Tax=Pseudomonas parafulva TaxID=157782 RepID=UPI0035633525